MSRAARDINANDILLFLATGQTSAAIPAPIACRPPSPASFSSTAARRCIARITRIRGLTRLPNGRLRPTPSTASSRCCASCSTITSPSTSPRRSICRARPSATSSPPTTRRTARRCRDDLAEQIPWSTRPARRSACRSSRTSGYEADDVIGTLAEQAAAAGFDVAIVTGDKDFFQLVGDGIRVFNPRDEGTWYDAAGVKEKFGVAPDQVVDVLALMGDTIDNVKGVPGIGEKGARELIATYGIARRAARRTPADVTQKKYREALLAHADEARQQPRAAAHPDRRAASTSTSRRFATAAPIARALLRAVHRARVPLARRWSTRRRRTRSTRTTRSSTTGGRSTALRRASCERAGRFALRVLADGADGHARRRSSASRSRPAARRAGYVPIGPHGARCRRPSSSRATALGGAAAAARGSRDREGRPRSEVRRDRARAPRRRRSRGLDARHDARQLPARRHALGHPLEDVGARASRLQGADRGRRLRHGARRRSSLADLPADGGRSTSPASAPTWRCSSPIGWRRCSQRTGSTRVYRDLELPLDSGAGRHRARRRPHRRARRWPAQSQHIERELAQRAARRSSSWPARRSTSTRRSSSSEILFDKLQLPALEAHRQDADGVDGGRGARGAGAHARAAAAHPRVARAAEAEGHLHRRAAAARATRRPAACTRRFNQAVAATGRLSSSDPNLQNIPIRTELGREIRRAFIADPGHVLISADYSQIELRVLAHLAGDETLIDAFRRGEDIHDRTALKVFGADSGLDTHELRRRAKIINYALLYGKTAFTLSQGHRRHASRRRRSSSTPTSPASRACARSSIGRSRRRARPAWSRRCSAGGGWCRS